MLRCLSWAVFAAAAAAAVVVVVVVVIVVVVVVINQVGRSRPASPEQLPRDTQRSEAQLALVKPRVLKRRSPRRLQLHVLN
jgi:hypothetical protein